MKLVVILANDDHWGITTPVAIVNTVEEAIEYVESHYQEDESTYYTYRTTEYITDVIRRTDGEAKGV